MRESKECLECGGIYFRPEGYTQERWEVRVYCCPACAGKANIKRTAAGAKKPEPGLEPTVAKEEETLEPPGRQPIVRDLKVVRVGPNPRMIVCEYYELASRRTCTVLVKRNDKFVRGMRLRLAEPASELDFRRPWVYSGPAPRRRGKW